MCEKGFGVCEYLWFGKHGGTPGCNIAVTAGFILFYDSIRIPHFTKSGCPINYIQPSLPLAPRIYPSHILERVKMHEPTEKTKFSALK
jgi:hypothetical protein